jgi:rRNA maturation RNase YbeY
LKNWIQEVIRLNNHQTGHLSFVFCTDDYILEVNKKFLNHDYYTDIITFDYKESTIVSGDFIISIDRVKDNALTHQSAFHKELYRVIIHGVLHLLGFSDKTETQQMNMRLLEDRYLAQLVEYQHLTNQ